jgi:hypothetical protein
VGLEELVVSMNRLGIRYTVLESGADGAVLILPEYGRVLGVWPHWRGENALWVNPDFLRMLEIGAKEDGWLNPGGDRMWLGPPEEFFPPDTVPPSLDPGKYEGATEKGMFTMENRGQVHAWNSGMMVGFRIQRRIRSLSEQEISDMWGTRWLRQAGYAEETTLDVFRDVPPEAWLWNLTQVPEGAEISGTRGETAGRTLGIEEREDGRGQLVVKSFELPAGEKEAGLAGAHPSSQNGRSAPGGARVISCSSASVNGRDRRRVVLRTTLCAFSGRTAELRATAGALMP